MSWGEFKPMPAKLETVVICNYVNYVVLLFLSFNIHDEFVHACFISRSKSSPFHLAPVCFFLLILVALGWIYYWLQCGTFCLNLGGNIVLCPHLRS